MEDRVRVDVTGVQDVPMEEKTMKAEEMWRQYCLENGMDETMPYIRHGSLEVHLTSWRNLYCRERNGVHLPHMICMHWIRPNQCRKPGITV